MGRIGRGDWFGSGLCGEEGCAGRRFSGDHAVRRAVAADDGVKPQTLEALKAINEANIPYLVAISKIDKANADIEKTKNLRMAHKLNPNILSPSNIQRVSVKYAAAIFHESTIAALEYHAKLEWQQTAQFLKWAKKLWDILNVQRSQKGKEKRNIHMDPITSILDWKLDALNQYKESFICWQTTSSFGLSRETFSAFILSLESINCMAYHLIQNCGFSYVLTGNVNSDFIERRFGQYRQMSGGNYYISTKNAFDRERKVKILSLLEDPGFNIKETEFHSLSNLDICEEEIHFFLNDCCDISPDCQDQAIIFYVAGYIAQSLLKKKNCESYRTQTVFNVVTKNP